MRQFVLLGAFAAAGLLSSAASASTLDDVRERGKLLCGVNSGLVGFAAETNGNWEGFDVAICRAVAAAVLSDPTAVEFVGTNSDERFDRLINGEVDMLARNTTWTFSRDVGQKLTFTGIYYYDGQGFMVPKSLKFNSAKELAGSTICVEAGTTSEVNLVEFFKVHNIEKYELVKTSNDAEALDLYISGACDVYTTDASGLAAARATLGNPGEHVILPEFISKEPLGPVVRQDDDVWGDVVRWTLNALITAEELDVTSANVNEMAEKPTAFPEVNRLLGTEGEFGTMLGLDPGWAKRAIAANGNYGEIFEKHIGERTPIGLARGLNALWTDGGLIYSPPFR